MDEPASKSIEFKLQHKPVFVPLFERENNRKDGTGLMDHTKVVRNGKEKEVTNFDVMQTAFRECIPPRKLHYMGAWTEGAKEINAQLRAQQTNGEITSKDVFQRFVVGVYIQDLTAE